MAGYVVTALWDFDAGADEELSFPGGARLRVLEDDNQEWYRAEYNGSVGMVPKNYFEVTGESDVDDDFDDFDDYDGDAAPASRGKPSVLIVRVLYDYEATTSEELSITQGEVLQVVDDSDPEWYLAKPIVRLGEQGYVPKSYVEEEAVPASTQPKKPKKEKKDKVIDPLKEEEKRRRAEEKQKKREEDAKRKEEENKEREKRREEENKEREKRREEEAKEREKRREEEAKERERRKEEDMKRREEDQKERERRREEERKFREESERIEAERLAAERLAFQKKMSARVARTINNARVTSWEKRGGFSGGYFFIIDVNATVGNYIIARSYQEFYDFQIQLLETFPTEAGEGSNGAARTIPYLPGQKLIVNEAVTKQRKVDLDLYCQQLAKMPEHIMSSFIVTDFFGQRQSDELAYGAAGSSGSAGSGESASAAPLNPAPVRTAPARRPVPSIPGDRSSVVRSAAAGEDRAAVQPPWARGPATTTATSQPARRPPPPGDSGAAPARPRPAPGATSAARPRPPPSIAAQGGAPAASAPRQQRPPPAAARPRPGPSAAPPSASTSADGTPKIKVKAYYKEEVVCTLVPQTVRFTELRSRLFAKLGTAPKPLQYKDEDGDMVTLHNDEDLALALEANPARLVVWVSL